MNTENISAGSGGEQHAGEEDALESGAHVAHEPLIVDVLVPEGLGDRADVRTIGTGTAFPAPGIRQALTRTELVPVLRATTAWVPRPDLLGAIVAKATALMYDTVDPERHRSDVAFLCGLVADPFALAAQVSRGDRKRLRAAARHLPESARAWQAAPGSPLDALAALRVLVGG